MAERPKSTDSIWLSGVDWETDAMLGDLSSDWIMYYAQSYKVAADTIVLQVEQKQVHPNIVGYAVCFLYRHYVEIMLKGLIRVGRILRDEAGYFPTEHSLETLWQQCKPLIEEAHPKDQDPHTDAVEQCLKELHTLDPSGESFRYGELKLTKDDLKKRAAKGKAVFRKEKQINLINLRDVMGRIAGFLEENYDWMNVLWVAKTKDDNT